MASQLPLQDKIAQSTTLTKGYRKKEMRLGNGFSSRAPADLNPVTWSGTITWDNLLLDDFNTLVAFIDTIGSWGTFLYTPHASQTAIQFAISEEGPSISMSSGNVFSISIVVRQEYDIQ